MNIFRYIKSKLSGKSRYDKILQSLEHETKSNIDQLKPILLDNYDPNKQTILIVDDYEGIITLFNSTFKDMEDRYTDFHLSDYNYITVSSIYAGYRVLKYMADRKVDYLITDVTFGGKIRGDNETEIVDGIDLVIELRKVNPDLKYVVFTGHVVGPKSYLDPKHFAYKMYNYNKDTLYNKVFMKDDIDLDRVDIIHKFITTGEFNRTKILDELKRAKGK